MGGGGGGGSSYFTTNLVIPLSRRGLRTKDLFTKIFSGEAEITSSCLGGGGSGGACVTRLYDLSDIVFDENGQFYIDVTIGAGGKSEEDGGRSVIGYTLGKTKVKISASGGGGGKQRGAGKCTSGALQYTGGEHQALDKAWKFGSHECAGQDGAPPGRGGQGQADGITDHGTCYPSCGGGASGLDAVYSDSETVWWKFRSGLIYGDALSDHPGSANYMVGLIQGEEVTLNLIPDELITGDHVDLATVGSAVVKAFNSEHVNNFAVDSLQVYRNGSWETISEDSGALKIILSGGHEAQNVAQLLKDPNSRSNGFNGLQSYLRLTGRLIGEEGIWYRINWRYTVSSISNFVGNLFSGRWSTEEVKTKTFDFKLMSAVVPDGTRSGTVNYVSTGAYCELKSDGSEEYVEVPPTYGGGGCSTMSPSRYTGKKDKKHMFSGTPGKDGFAMIEIIALPNQGGTQ